MINLDQVRTLEWKVKQAVQLIVHLRRENDTLRGRLSDTEVRLQELESMLESFKATQNEMESGIRNALEDLDNLEGEPVSLSSGPVDPLSYPPVEVETPAAFAAEDPAALFDKSSSHEPVDTSFEEEYAALAAAEALAATTFDAPAPESVELEEAPEGQVEPVDESEPVFEAVPDSEPEPVVPEEKQPEQPGLGIF